MFKALVLICHATILPADCTVLNASDVLQAPSANSAIRCLAQGQAFAASLPALRLEGHYAKVICRRGGATMGYGQV